MGPREKAESFARAVGASLRIVWDDEDSVQAEIRSRGGFVWDGGYHTLRVEWPRPVSDREDFWNDVMWMMRDGSPQTPCPESQTSGGDFCPECDEELYEDGV